ncbi:MAG: diguanylate cyclase [Alphaproteobacteria bacterium]|nr:diguanylate cyclase [Alphaproteobacteria bacterium]
MGVGVWAMHFTGMLALTLPVPVTYAAPTTIISVIPAMLASALALYVMSSRGNRHRRYWVGGTLVGAGIGAMHYIGMAAMRVEYCVHPYDPGLFVVSVVVAVLLGIAAFYSRDLPLPLRGLQAERVRLVIAAGLMGLAIAGMHYTAMAAAAFLPSGSGAPNGATLDKFWLGIGVVSTSAVIILLAIIATIVGRAFQTTTRNARVDRARIVEAIDSLSDGFTLYDDQGSLRMCNRVLHDMYPQLSSVLRPGMRHEDLIAAWTNLRNGMLKDTSTEAPAVEDVSRFKTPGYVALPREDRLHDGRWVYIRDHSIEQGGLATVFTDVTPIKELQALYEKLATQDALTGLLNRRFLEDRLNHAIAVARRHLNTIAMLYIDLDHFKPINDKLGHDAGDEVLKEVARRLRQAGRDSDTIARLGGDEFAVLMECGGDQPGAEALAKRILASLAEPIFVGKHECRVGASIGITVVPPQTIGLEEVIKAADAAMYAAKNEGRGQYRIHQPASVQVPC